MAKLVDAPDSKSGVAHPTCRFDSGHRHIFYVFVLIKGVEPPVLTSHKMILNHFVRQSGHRHIFYVFVLIKGVEPPVLTSHKMILNHFVRQSGHRHIFYVFVLIKGVESAFWKLVPKVFKFIFIRLT